MAKSILLIGNHPPPYGGVPTHIESLASFLSRRDWNVHVLSFSGKQAAVLQMSGYTVQIYRPSMVHKLASAATGFFTSPLTSMSRLWRLRTLALNSTRLLIGYLILTRFVKQMVIENSIDIISAYHILGAGSVGALVSEELSVPLVTTVFGGIYDRPHLHRRRLAEVDYVCKVSSRLLSCSRHCAESYTLLGLSPKVEVVYYGVDIDRFSPKNNGGVMQRRLGIDDGNKVVIFVGRMIPEMGLHVLLQSIPRVLQARERTAFIIAGAKGELSKLALNLSAAHEGKVFVVQDVPSNDLPFCYAASSIAVVPSTNERACSSLAGAEAMAAGKPVVASRIGGIPEIVIDGETGILVPPEDSLALSETIISLLDDNESQKEMGMHGRKRAETLFDKAKNNQEIEQIFYDVLT